MKFLFVGDVHVADTPPSKRDHNYREDILRKLEEIVDIATAAKVDAVLFAGDIFHHKQPRKVSHRLVLDLLRIFGAFPVQVYILVGNHDITEGRLESLEKQPLGVLGKSPNVTLLTWDSTEVRTESEHVTLHPVPGVPKVTLEDFSSQHSPEATSWNIGIVHQSIFEDVSKLPFVLQDKPFIFKAEEVAKAMPACGLILYGHEHSRHGIYKSGGTMFVNLGSICRGTINDSDLNKEPSVFLFELTDKIAGKEIKLKNVRPADKCFLLEEHFEGVSHKQDIEDAINKLKDTRLEKFSIEAVIGDVEVRDDLDEPVRDAALQLLETVR